MKIISKDIASLKQDPKNARKHNKKNLDAIKGSLLKFGQVKPIVIDEAGIVVAGNGTLEAAKQIGWSKINAVVTDLKEVEKTAFAIADNRTAELAEWDDETLNRTLSELETQGFNISEIGFVSESDIGDDEGPEVFDDAESLTEITVQLPSKFYTEAINKIRHKLNAENKNSEIDIDTENLFLYLAMFKRFCETTRKRFSVIVPMPEAMWKTFSVNPDKITKDIQEYLYDKYNSDTSSK